LPTDREDDAHECILVLRFSSLGDVLLIAPAIRALGRRFPEARIDLLVAQEFADAAGLVPGIDRIITFDRRGGFAELLRVRAEISRRYAVMVDLQSSLRSAFLRLFALPTLWVKAERYRFRRWLLIHTKRVFYPRVISVPERYLAALDTFGVTDDGRGLELRRQLDAGEMPLERKYVVLCPGAKHATKRWPRERWIELGRNLRSAGLHVAVIGSADEREELTAVASAIPAAICLSGLPIPRVAATLQFADCVISNDSGLMHLAAGLNVPVVALFGPTVEWFGFFPFRAQSVVLQNELPCRPCSAFGGQRCPRVHFRCMLETSVEQVANAVTRFLNPPEVSRS
jgi:ADP-heptose:LPS heptosyltransferase